MFNGIIFNTGIVRFIKKTKNSAYIGIKSNLKFKKKILAHLFAVMVFV